MIIFYDKTGKIVGTIDGRVHSDDHLKMWVGDKQKTDRLILDWESVEVGEEEIEENRMVAAGKDDSGEILYKKRVIKKKIPKIEWRPRKQPQITRNLDSGKKKIRDYRVDVKNKKLVLI